MNNWKTTLGGALSALGTSLAGCATVGALTLPEYKILALWCIVGGALLSALGKFFGLLFAVDANPPNNATSQGSKFPLILLAGSLALMAVGLGCAAVAPGNDPLIVRVEQVQTTAKGSFDLVLKVDDANRNFYRTNAPAFHQFCEWLRVPTGTTDGGILPRASAMLWTLDAEKLAYKNGTASSNAVITALSVVVETTKQTQVWLAAVKP